MSGTIFRTSLFLALGGALSLAVASIVIIVLNPVPFDFPVSTYEVGRLMRGEPLVRSDRYIVSTVEQRAPAIDPGDEVASLLARSLADQLGVAPDRVVFAFDDQNAWIEAARFDIARNDYERLMRRSIELYGNDPRYAPLILRSFRAGLRLPDGRWRTISRLGPMPGPQMQWGLVKWIGLVLAFIIPIAWLFSRRIARPIRAFAQAADRIGGGSFEHVDEVGPSEIKTAAAALNAMQSRISRFIDERTAVIGAIAHDLRAPLARLSFMLAEATPQVRARIEAEIAGMERLIAVTLDYVQGETARPRPELVDLRLLVESIIDDFADMGRDAAIEPGLPVTVIGDPVLLGRLFTNIIDNALVYGKRARARLFLTDESAIVEIDDDGPGMTSPDLARAFEPFFRAERSRNAATGGIGLGLSIVRSLAVAHQGDVTLENRAEGGLRATITLPTVSIALAGATGRTSLLAAYSDLDAEQRRALLKRRGGAFALALGVELLLLWLILTTRTSDRPREVATSIKTFDMAPLDRSVPTKLTRRDDGGSARRVASKTPPPKVPPMPNAAPDPMAMTPDEFAATDISKLPSSKGAAPSNDGSGRGVYGPPGGGPGNAQIYDADWYRKPTQGELAQYFPQGTKPGWGLIVCQTAPRYRVENCQALGESPPGSGFASALRQASWQFQVIPPRLNHRPIIGAWVKIRFDLTEGEIG